ncbi:MAG: hypothetical protein RLY74_257 [Actinomycetota bacterium]
MPDRLELARRLHDGPAQQIVALGLSLDELISNQNLEGPTRNQLRKIRLDLLLLSRSLRDEIYLLRTKSLFELEAILKDILGEIRVDINLPNLSLGQDVEDAIVRAISEIARNSARHSRCDRFSVKSVVSNNLLVLEVSDNGVGGITHSDRNFGIRSISEAIEMVGGCVNWESDGTGSRYLVTIRLA